MKPRYLIVIGTLMLNSARADFGLDCFEPINDLWSPTQIYLVDIGDGAEVYIEEYRSIDKTVDAYTAKRIKKTDNEYTYYRKYTDFALGASGTDFYYEYTVSRKASYIKRHAYNNPNKKNYGATKVTYNNRCTQMSIIDMERVIDAAKKAEQKRIQQKKKREQQKIEQDRIKF